MQGVARDLAAAGVGRLIDRPAGKVEGRFPCPVRIQLPAPELCPVFAGRVIRGVRNGPSPEWLQARLKAVGLRPINALVDITQFLTHDRRDRCTSRTWPSSAAASLWRGGGTASTDRARRQDLRARADMCSSPTARRTGPANGLGG